jgi:hypothetical protein
VVGDVDEAADTAQQAVLQRVERAIGISYLPQHLQQLHPALVAEPLVDDAGDAEELCRLLGLALGRPGQPIGRSVVEHETLFEQAPNDIALARIERAVDLCRLHEERGNGEPEPVSIAFPRFFSLLEPRFEPFDHRPA